MCSRIVSALSAKMTTQKVLMGLFTVLLAFMLFHSSGWADPRCELCLVGSNVNVAETGSFPTSPASRSQVRYGSFQSGIVIVVWNQVIKQARLMAGTASHMGVPLFVVGLDLSLEYIAEMTNNENVVYLSKTVLSRPDFDSASFQLAGLAHAASVFPEKCLHFVDLTTGLWNDNGTFYAPRKIDCGADAIRYGKHNLPHLPNLLLPPKWVAPQVHTDLAAWVEAKSKCIHREYDPLEPVPTANECASEALSIVQRIFAKEKPSEDAVERWPTYLGNRPSCWSRHVIRTQPLRPFVSDKTKLCLAAPTLLTPGIPLKEQRFFKYLLTSLRESMTTKPDKVARRLYVLFENNDPLFHIPGNEAEVRQLIAEYLKDLDFEIIIVIVPYADTDNVYFWNTMFAGGYDDGCEYMYQLCDDVDLFNTKGVGYDWESKFISLLKNADPPNVGAIGNPAVLNTMPFVHRTHYEIFGKLYTRHVHNVMGDTIHYNQYKQLGLLRGPNDMEWIKNWSENKSIGRRYKACEVPFVWDWDDFNSDMYRRFANNRKSKGLRFLQSQSP